MRMETKVFICALCVCLVAVLGDTTPPKTTTRPKINSRIFLTYIPSEKTPVNGSDSEQMTNHTLSANITQESILETTVAPNLAENDVKQNDSDTTQWLETP